MSSASQPEAMDALSESTSFKELDNENLQVRYPLHFLLASVSCNAVRRLIGQKLGNLVTHSFRLPVYLWPLVMLILDHEMPACKYCKCICAFDTAPSSA
jgi:hypothetical protein